MHARLNDIFERRRAQKVMVFYAIVLGVKTSAKMSKLLRTPASCTGSRCQYVICEK